MTELPCAGGCGKTMQLNKYQQEAVRLGVFQSWTCGPCAKKAALQLLKEKK